MPGGNVEIAGADEGQPPPRAAAAESGGAGPPDDAKPAVRELAYCQGRRAAGAEAAMMETKRGGRAVRRAGGRAAGGGARAVQSGEALKFQQRTRSHTCRHDNLLPKSIGMKLSIQLKYEQGRTISWVSKLNRKGSLSRMFG